MPIPNCDPLLFPNKPIWLVNNGCFIVSNPFPWQRPHGPQGSIKPRGAEWTDAPVQDWKCYRNRGVGKRQAALKDAEQQGLFSTGAGSAELPLKAECPGFVLGVFYTPETSSSKSSDPSPATSKITEAKVVIDEQQLFKTR